MVKNQCSSKREIQTYRIGSMLGLKSLSLNFKVLRDFSGFFALNMQIPKLYNVNTKLFNAYIEKLGHVNPTLPGKSSHSKHFFSANRKYNFLPLRR